MCVCECAGFMFSSSECEHNAFMCLSVRNPSVTIHTFCICQAIQLRPDFKTKMGRILGLGEGGTCAFLVTFKSIEFKVVTQNTDSL